MKRVLKLMADYQSFPIWRSGDEIGNVNPANLSITEELKLDLKKWAAAFDRTLDHKYPPDSRFPDQKSEEAFEAEGIRLWRDLKNQLGENFEVVYYSSRDSKLYE